MMNTLIRVLPVTLIRVLEHTLVWVSSNNLYVVYHRLAVLMLYILLFIAVVNWRLCVTLITFLPASDLKYYGSLLLRITKYMNINKE